MDEGAFWNSQEDRDSPFDQCGPPCPSCPSRILIKYSSPYKILLDKRPLGRYNGYIP